VVVVVVVRAGGDGAGSAGSARSRDAVGATRPEEASGESRRSADAEIVADLAARAGRVPLARAGARDARGERAAAASGAAAAAVAACIVSGGGRRARARGVGCGGREEGQRGG